MECGRVRAVLSSVPADHLQLEKGATRPGGAIQAVLRALRTELRGRTENQCVRELKNWKEELADEDVLVFLEAIQAHPSRTEEIYTDLIRRSENEGGCMIGDSPEATSAFVIPLTPNGLRAFLDRLLGGESLTVSGSVIRSLVERLVPSSSQIEEYAVE